MEPSPRKENRLIPWPAGVAPLEQLVNTADGSVVSRVLLKRKTGNVTLFAFDVNQELSEHTAPFDALVQVVQGEAEITIGGSAAVVKAGEVILLPAGRPHAVRALTAMKMLLTMIRE